MTTTAERNQPAIPPSEAAQPAPSRAIFSARVYARSPEGFVVEVETTEAERPIGWINTMTENLKKQGFTAVEPFPPATINIAPPAAGEAAVPARGRGGRPAKAAAKYTGEAYSDCDWCHGPIYDNRKKKTDDPSWRGPWYKCKDGDGCGWVVFANDGAAQE